MYKATESTRPLALNASCRSIQRVTESRSEGPACVMSNTKAISVMRSARIGVTVSGIATTGSRKLRAKLTSALVPEMEICVGMELTRAQFNHVVLRKGKGGSSDIPTGAARLVCT